MSFPAALERVISGYAITRREWANPSTRVLLYDRALRIRKDDGTLAPLLVSDGDLLATDWVLVHDA